MTVKNSKIMLIQWSLLFLLCLLPIIPQMMDTSYNPPPIQILCSAIYFAYTAVCAMLYVKLYADIIFICYGIATLITVILTRAAGDALLTKILSVIFIFPHMGTLRLFGYSDIPLIILSLIMITVPILKRITSGKSN